MRLGVAAPRRTAGRTRVIELAELSGSRAAAFDACVAGSVQRAPSPAGVSIAALAAYRKGRLLGDGPAPGRPMWAVMAGRRMEACAVLEPLGWDSSIYGLRMARINIVMDVPDPLGQRRTAAALLQPVLGVCARRGIEHVAVRVDDDEYGCGAALEDAGFRFVDGTVTLTRSLSTAVEPKGQQRVRAAAVRDITALQRVAAAALVHGRAYHDPRLPVAKNREMNRRWIASNCRGRADAVLVYGRAGRAEGFVCCHVDVDARRLLEVRLGSIDLLAVDPGSQGKGIGRTLVRGALRWFSGRVELVEIRTQLNNRAGLAAFQREGFQIVSKGITLLSGYTYHRWTTH